MTVLSLVGGVARQANMHGLGFGLMLLAWSFPTTSVAAGDSKAWSALAQGGHVMLMRHGNAPGATLGRGSDPAGFELEDCTTQRNLDDVGRAQAKAVGERIRSRGVAFAKILSSPWCRCRETAELMNVGQLEVSRALSLLVPTRPNAADHERSMREVISAWRGPGTLLLVSHGMNIKQLTGRDIQQAEALVLKPEPANKGGFAIVGQIAPPS